MEDLRVSIDRRIERIDGWVSPYRRMQGSRVSLSRLIEGYRQKDGKMDTDLRVSPYRRMQGLKG